MKIQIVSDIHLEFFTQKKQINKFIDKLLTDAEVLILAGDITVLNDKLSREYLIYFLDLICNHYNKIIYVLGNHEYYDGDFNNVLNQLQEIINKYNNVYLLENSSCTINNVIFYGTTLWFKETPQAILNTYYLNDFKCINNFNPYEANTKAINYINSIEESNLKQVLITHHLPSYESVSADYLREVTNCYYVCGIEDQLYKFNLASHGHTHHSNDYLINNTRVISNPYGYLGQNKEFEFNKVVEL